MQATISRSTAGRPALAARTSRRSVVSVRAMDTNLAVSAATAASLIVGRFAFLPFQRRTQDKSQAVGPKTTGSTYFDALQQDASFITTTGDPAGFTIIDTMGWGALGHAVAFAFLGASSSGVIPGVN
ncbi:MAG: photosystem I reaction center subunit V [Monoraphidium minutum]|nr:MAG: photosystem I reaction center subunit V [Monoraphidium minutum]